MSFLHDSLEPGTLGQSYRLDQVAGDALPTVLSTNEVGTFHIISQFIHFGPKGSGSLLETAQMVPHTGELGLAFLVLCEMDCEADYAQ